VHQVMSGIVITAGLYLVLFADASAEFRIFGWVLVVIGVLGLLGGALMRRRPRS
jgi:hypothetical protein